MKYQLEYQIHIGFTLTDDEFKILDEAFVKSEYKHLAKIGGFWYGQSGSRNFIKDQTEREDHMLFVSNRDAQKLLKSLEPYATFAYTEDADPRFIIYCKLRKVIEASISTSNALNTHSGINAVKL